jgi:hypothetical protein
MFHILIICIDKQNENSKYIGKLFIYIHYIYIYLFTLKFQFRLYILYCVTHI